MPPKRQPSVAKRPRDGCNENEDRPMLTATTPVPAVQQFPASQLSKDAKFIPRPQGFVPGKANKDRTPEEKEYMEACYGYGYANFKDRMNPEYFVYAFTKEDVALTTKFCNDNNVALAIRTGAHHYLGCSASKPGTVVLDVSLSKIPVEKRVNHDWMQVSIDDTTGIITAGCGAGLGDFALDLDKHGLFLPFGQCMTVCVGGHSQSGGNGPAHTSTTGYLSDYIHSFQVVLADGTIKNLYRKDEDRKKHNQTEEENDLFWAMAGASPGSFGVCLKASFQAMRNDEWETPLNYSRTKYPEERVKQLWDNDPWLGKGNLPGLGIGTGIFTYPAKMVAKKERFHDLLQFYAECNDSYDNPDVTKWKAPLGVSFTLYVVSPGGPRWTNTFTGEWLPNGKLPEETPLMDDDDYTYRMDCKDRMPNLNQGSFNNDDVNNSFIVNLLKGHPDGLPNEPLMIMACYAFRRKDRVLNQGPDPKNPSAGDRIYKWDDEWEGRVQKFFADLEAVINPGLGDLLTDAVMYHTMKGFKNGPKADPANTMSEATLTTTFPVEKEYLRPFEKHNTMGGVKVDPKTGHLLPRTLAKDKLWAGALTDAFFDLWHREQPAAGQPQDTKDKVRGVLELILGGPGTNPNADQKNFQAHRGGQRGWLEWETWWTPDEVSQQWANNWTDALAQKMHTVNGEHLWCESQRKLVALPYRSDDIMENKQTQLDFWETEENVQRLWKVKKFFDSKQTFSASKFGIGGEKGSDAWKQKFGS